jgi:hypothetical protein
MNGVTGLPAAQETRITAKWPKARFCAIATPVLPVH